MGEKNLYKSGSQEVVAAGSGSEIVSTLSITTPDTPVPVLSVGGLVVLYGMKIQIIR